MATNLLDSVKGLFTNDLVGRASAALGESEGSLQKALSGAIPSILAGVLNRAGDGGNSVFDLARQASDSGVLDNLADLMGGKRGNNLGNLMGMAGIIFGDKQNNVARLLSGFSGIKESSSNSLLILAAPVVLGVLGKHAKDNDMDSSGFLSFLNLQKSSILSGLPPGLNLAGALGLYSLSDIGGKLSNLLSGSADKEFTRQTKEPVKKTATWLWPVAAGLAIILLATYIINSGSARKIADKIQAQNLIPPKASASDITAPIKQFFKVQLPNGSTLDAYKGGVEDKLVSCLSNPSCTAGNDNWFDFDALNFEMGSSTITEESQKQISNIASIMNAYPSAKIKIGGYTDLKGHPSTNKRISQERAEAVAMALRASGVKSSQIAGVEGYGSEFATVPVDASNEMRAKDRRISIQLYTK